MATMANLLAVFGIGHARYQGDAMSLEQVLGPAVADHRGRIEIPAYAAMVESVMSGAFWYSFGEPVGTVLPWLSVTAAAPVDTNQRLLARSTAVHRDDVYGAMTVQITNDRNDVVCAGVGRCVRVGRTSEPLMATKTYPVPTADGPLFLPPEPATLPPPIDRSLDGRQIVAAISDARLPTGQLCESLCATVSITDGGIALTVSPQPWMANPLGGMQGGVVTAILGQACSLAGQLYTRPGQQYAPVDLTAHFLKSPPVDRGNLTVTTALDKLGRRLATVSATMAGPDGVPLARAVADIQYDGRQ